MTKQMLKRIDYAIDWYQGTDGSEREHAADEMCDILIELYNQEITKKR